ncbi:MAG: PLP-dependent aminotransferase family protein [Chloroflexi bacterium]|nr:PLP-dependent aminotransferase family protein [Chloroflexota bacterium]
MSLSRFHSPVARAMEQNPLRPNWSMQRPGVLSLAFGFPDAASFPYDDLGRVTRDLMAQRNADALQYGPVSGPEPLRAFVADWVRSTEGLPVGPEHVLITSGASQAIVLTARLLVPAGGTILVESPTFIGALWFLRGLGLEVVGVPADEQGIDPEALEGTVQRLRTAGTEANVVYTMPTVHNPIGTNASDTRRRELADLAQRLDLALLEDDAYGDLIFDGSRPKALYALAGSERVIKMGTFSKLVAGGMRLGWALADPEDVATMCSLKADSASSPFAAWAAAEYLAGGALSERVPALRTLYRARRDAMLEELQPLARLGCTWTRPVGGFFVWLTLPEGVDSEAIRPTIEDHGVTYLAGHHCFADGARRRDIRLAYSYLPEDQIREGVRRLVRGLEAVLAD